MWCSTRSSAEPGIPARPLGTPAGRARVRGLVSLSVAATLLVGLAWPRESVAQAEAPTAAAVASDPRADTRSDPRLIDHPQLPGSRLRGQAQLRLLGLGIYQARLWALPGFRADQALDQPVVLELTYLREFQGSSIAQRSLDEMRRAGPLSEAQAQRWLAEMRRLFPDVRPGDRIAGLHLPGQGARFWQDGRPLGEVADADFGRRFFGVWLAPSTSQPAMRLSLLGLAAAGSL